MGKKFTDPLNHEFEFPQSLIEQINEATSSGFLLFITDNYGNILPIASFDNPIVEIAVRTKALEFLNSLKKVSQIQSTQQLLIENGMIIPDDEDDEE